jgi:hypothetical protein
MAVTRAFARTRLIDRKGSLELGGGFTSTGLPDEEAMTAHGSLRRPSLVAP